MKAMSQTLYILVAAIIILVTAVVIISVFLQGVGPAVGLTEAKSLCQTQLATSCATFGQVPATWSVQNVNIDGEEKSCAQITNCGCNPDTKTMTGECASGQQIRQPTEGSR